MDDDDIEVITVVFSVRNYQFRQELFDWCLEYTYVIYKACFQKSDHNLHTVNRIELQLMFT